MAPDPRWLEILKASGWQTAAIASACGLFLLAGKWGWIPPLDAWMIQLAAFGLLVSGLLAVASFISAALKFFPIQKWGTHWVKVRRMKRDLRNYIPHMTEQERKIIGYLLAKNQKMFTAESDGGYAATLLARGIVCIAAQRGQHVDMLEVPMTIPDPLWDVLVQHKSEFPYTERGKAPPWRVPWMAR